MQSRHMKKNIADVYEANAQQRRAARTGRATNV